ncbi:hypothetical protein GGF43_000263 [Coemansia sp. RSA 2618]|nr:hypothetical protein GGF43_000263 [Coemansia sp. RSA 2618]
MTQQPQTSAATPAADPTNPFDKSWMQTLFTQTSNAHIPVSHDNSALQTSRGFKRTMSEAMPSENDSEDISKSLSLFLSQQLLPGQQQQQHMPDTGFGQFQHIPGTKELSTIIGAPSSGGGGEYNLALTDILESGYDNGARRVISMPNPLGNLSFEIPINPPVQPSMGMGYGFMPSQCALANSRMPTLQQQQQQQQQRPAPPNGMFGPKSTGEGVLGIHSMSSAPALVKFDDVGKSGDETRATDSSSPEQPMSQQLSPLLGAMPASGEQSWRPPLPNPRLGAHTTAPSPAVCTDDTPSLLGISCSSTPLLGSSSASISALLPHRVDRQLAAAGARPLLFVRPNAKGSQARRKRRCVSTDTIVKQEKVEHVDAAADASNNQWQRISEQRRRDAMRENFDLLKRMLPQAYMDSDDGRELARPVLLARFLRWVDDTLIEMENLKVEVAHLRMVARDSALHADATQLPALNTLPTDSINASAA